MDNLGKILAIDYGTKRLGLAVCDSGRTMAFGRGILDRSKGMKTVGQFLQKLCVDEGIKEVVFGLPLGNENEETEQTERVRNFAKKLGLYLPDMRMSFFDESFTSYQADQFLAQMELKPHERRQSEDELAAIFILNRYLESQKGVQE